MVQGDERPQKFLTCIVNYGVNVLLEYIIFDCGIGIPKVGDGILG